MEEGVEEELFHQESVGSCRSSRSTPPPSVLYVRPGPYQPTMLSLEFDPYAYVSSKSVASP